MSKELWVNDFPISLHIRNRPTPEVGFVEGFVEPANMRMAIVSPFTLSIRVMNQQAEPSALTRRGPLQHLQITVGVTE